jgi:predicted amidophosphoribosyltransferase
MPLFEGYAKHLAAAGADPAVQPFFGQDVILVPAPGSALRGAGTLWVPEHICAAFVAENLGARVDPCLSRVAAVPKSATSPRHQRPNAQKHYDTMGVSGGSLIAERILVVDDVVTSGATLLAAVSRICDAFPHADVRAFALARAISDGDIQTTHLPIRGVIRLRTDGKTWRDP